MFKIYKLSSTVLYVMLAITVLVVGIFAFGGTIERTDEMVEPAYTDLLLYWAYALCGIAILATAGFAVMQFISKLKDHPKSALKSLAFVCGFALILIVTWLLGDSTPLAMQGYDGPDNVAFWLKMTDMLIYTIYILMAAAVLAVLSGSVMKYFGK